MEVVVRSLLRAPVIMGALFVTAVGVGSVFWAYHRPSGAALSSAVVPTGGALAATAPGNPQLTWITLGTPQSLKPSAEIGLGIPVQETTPEQFMQVVIVKDGSDLNVDGVRVRAVRNSHFDDPPGHPLDNGSQSQSYRLQPPSRTF